MSRIDNYNREALAALSEEAHLRLIELGTREFQEASKLTVDGWCGPKTRAVLESMFEDDAYRSPVELPAEVSAAEIPRGHAGIQRVYGKFEYTESSSQKGAIVIKRSWVRSHIGEVKLHTGRRVWLHKLAMPGFAKLFEQACEESGYTPERVGSWVPRHILWKPSKRLSTHSWGIAFDVDSSKNRWGKTDTLIRRHMRFVEVFEAAGWVWGGRWSTPDDMHFQRAQV